MMHGLGGQREGGREPPCGVLRSDHTSHHTT